jgi:hypothetical protein
MAVVTCTLEHAWQQLPLSCDLAVLWQRHLSPAAAALQVHGSSRIADGVTAEEIGMLTQLRHLKDLELNQCAPPLQLMSLSSLRAALQRCWTRVPSTVAAQG